MNNEAADLHAYHTDWCEQQRNRSVYSFAQSEGNDRCRSACSSMNGGGVVQSESEKAAEFNGQFTDVFTISEYSQVPLLDRSAPFMEDIVVTKEGVTKLLKGLNPSKALGPDELYPSVLKELATELGPILRIYSSSQLTLVISLRSGHLQTLVPCSRRVIDHLLAIIVPFP